MQATYDLDQAALTRLCTERIERGTTPQVPWADR